jgi:5-methylcytosine-specific restriction endonuclease McrA
MPTDLKTCLFCGGTFERGRSAAGNLRPLGDWRRQRFCSQTCSNRSHGKGDAASDSAKRRRANRLYALGACEDCGAPATERHHIDADTGNNRPENIARLCYRCHRTRDGRLERLAAYRHPIGPPRPCANCGRATEVGNLQDGRCSACFQWRQRHGQERPADLPFDGAAWRGERHHRARLTEADAVAIRARYAEGGISQRTLGQQYGVSRSAINHILLGKNWAATEEVS